MNGLRPLTVREATLWNANDGKSYIVIFSWDCFGMDEQVTIARYDLSVAQARFNKCASHDLSSLFLLLLLFWILRVDFLMKRPDLALGGGSRFSHFMKRTESNHPRPLRMGDQPKFTSDEALKPRTGLPKDDALYDEDKNVSINDSDARDARTYDASFPPPAGATATTSESERHQSQTGEDEKYQTDTRDFTSDTAFCHALSRVSLTRDKSGGSISTTQSDEGDDWKDMIELLPDNLSRCSLFRDVSGCSSIVTRQSVPSTRGPEENASAFDPASSRQTNEPLRERLERLSHSCQCDENKGYIDANNTSKPIPGFTSSDDFMRSLIFGTSSDYTPKVEKADSCGATGSYASTSSLSCSNYGDNGLISKSCENHAAFPTPWTSAPDNLAPLNLYFSRSWVQDPPRFSARAAPSSLPNDNNASPARNNQVNNSVPEDRIFISDGYQANDVLCGRGERITRHNGHKLFHKVKLNFQDQYRRTNIKKEKTALAEKLLKTMALEYGSRFLALCPEKKQWYVISHERAMLKAKQVLRENFTAEQRKRKSEKYKPKKMHHKENPKVDE